MAPATKGRSSPADLLGGRNGSALLYNQADQDENQRRELLLAYYLLRSPMYQAVTKYGLHLSLDLRLATANAVGSRPEIGLSVNAASGRS